MPRLSINPDDLEDLIQERLRVFYDCRIQILKKLKLEELLSKNLYLFRSMGVVTAAQLIEELMKSRLIKSDETIFGKQFFEAIAQKVGGGEEANQLGMDVVIETEDTYTVIEVKSASNWQNARMGRGVKADFDKAYERFLSKGLQKQFVGMLGQATGRVNCDADVDSGRIYVIRSGQMFWQEITDDPDFYLKLIRLMKDYPLRLRPDYTEAWANTANKMLKQFSDVYINSTGEIHWELLIQVNSGSTPIQAESKLVEEQLKIEKFEAESEI
ncbi:PmeII family type II restriction endonuclease [Leptolyngbyaceae cyanobacterium UHCC 1019]